MPTGHDWVRVRNSQTENVTQNSSNLDHTVKKINIATTEHIAILK